MCHSVLYKPFPCSLLPGFLLCATVYCTSHSLVLSYQGSCYVPQCTVQAISLFSPTRVLAMCHSVMYKPFPCSLLPGFLLCATVYCTSHFLVLSYQGSCYVPQCTVQAISLFSPTRVLAMCHSVLYKPFPCSLLPGFLLCATVYCTNSYQRGCSTGCCLTSRESSS